MYRRGLPLALLLAANVVACARDEAPATAASPPEVMAASAEPPATTGAAVETAAASQESVTEPAGDRTDSALERFAALPAADQLPAGRWQAGKHYKPIVPAQPTDAGAGKVEVDEVFWYGCAHCYALEPYLESWQKNKAAYVEFVRVPVMWGPVHRAHARFFYVIQALNRPDLHNKVFEEIHQRGNMLVGRDDESTKKMQFDFLEANGLKEADIQKAWDSFSVNSNLQRADQLTRRYRVEAVPLIVVGGKYTTDVAAAGGQSELLAVINDLAASEKRR